MKKNLKKLMNGNDDGSPLGRFMCKIFNLDPAQDPEDAVLADLATRGAYALIMGISCLALAWTGVLWYVLGVVILTVGVPVVVVTVD